MLTIKIIFILFFLYFLIYILYRDLELIPYNPYIPSCSCSCWGDLFKKSLRLHRFFKSNRDEIWHGCSSSKYASIDGVGFRIWRHTFKTAAMTLFSQKASSPLRETSLASCISYSTWSTVHSFQCIRSYFI